MRTLQFDQRKYTKSWIGIVGSFIAEASGGTHIAAMPHLVVHEDRAARLKLCFVNKGKDANVVLRAN